VLSGVPRKEVLSSGSVGRYVSREKDRPGDTRRAWGGCRAQNWNLRANWYCRGV
jgi:hypothetical protein